MSYKRKALSAGSSSSFAHVKGNGTHSESHSEGISTGETWGESQLKSDWESPATSWAETPAKSIGMLFEIICWPKPSRHRNDAAGEIVAGRSPRRPRDKR